jgi:alkanesulfonate monooxygenase SsuD/methylene tetrahydromethanopterin reductase-like flavin-dependent oxidoreductase (luciferase family)
MEFGVQVEPQFGFSFEDVVKIAETAVDSGFSSVWFSDHFMLDVDSTERVLLDPWLLMTALVMVNKKIRVGSLVFSQSYRNPALTAKMAATLDVLSGGRLEFGIGAGWKEMEYKAYGFEFPDAATRIEQLAEAIQIIRGIWENERFSFKGTHYTVEDVISVPKPLQTPMKIWVGSPAAKRKMLRLTAKFADGINLAWAYSPADCVPKFRRLDKFCQREGRDPSEMLKSVGLWTRFFETEEAMETAIKENAAKRGVSEQEYRERVSSSLWGTADQIVERLREYEQIGVSHLILMFPPKQELEQIKSMGKKVLSKL